MMSRLFTRMAQRDYDDRERVVPARVMRGDLPRRPTPRRTERWLTRMSNGRGTPSADVHIRCITRRCTRPLAALAAGERQR